MSAQKNGERNLYDLVVGTVTSLGRPSDSISVSASWTDSREWDAGLTADDQGITAFYGPASAAVESAQEAARILRLIFADEIVCVTALERDTPVHHALDRHDDPTASFTALDKPLARDMPAIDHVMVRSWTGKRDRD
jgi:hypothetical protein